MSSRAKLMVVLSSTGLVVFLLLGAMLGKSAAPEGAYRHLAVYTEVLSRIKSEYVEEPDLKSVTLGALNGLLESVDPFSSYLNADQYKEYQKKKDSQKGDVGLVLSKRFGYVGVVASVPGSPAGKLGLTTGDVLETIKGVATRDMPLAYAELLLRGEPGTSIEISVLRVRKPEPQKITLTRSAVSYPPVSSKMLADGIGYIRSETLAAGKVKEVAAAVTGLERQGAKKLVLDLRNCAVGGAEEGIALANLFIAKGKIGYLLGQRFARQDFEADAAKAITKLPLAVITSRGTAGPAEVAAAALLDSKRADLVGERTYGDAAVRKPVTMEDGGAVILSVAKYYSPAGKAIQDAAGGVTPQTLVQEPDSQIELDQDGEPVVKEDAEKKPGEDVLLKKAVEILGKKA
ncbi:MAG: carboxyl-terminal protease [Bryobacterales bacterium]|nr:carboxyl-terminal protease [Bryobacterales bacterium]